MGTAYADGNTPDGAQLMRPASGRWQALRNGLVGALRRFPVSVAALLGLAVYVNLGIAEVIDLTGDDFLRAHMALGSAAMVAAAAMLVGERLRIETAQRHVMSLLPATALGLTMWHWEQLGIAFPALFLAAALTIPLAPYLRRDPSGFWAFAWHLLHAAALAFLAVIIFCLGLSAIFASIDYLFGVDIDSDVYEHIWATGLGFVGPVFALSLIPAGFPERDAPEPNDAIVAGARVLFDFVVVPLLLNYAAVLHVYAAKIALIDGTLPRGQIGWMVLGFGLAVLGARIIVHPMGALVRWPTRLFLRFWAIGLVVPLGLLAVAVWERIDTYGITPERYALALFALVLAIVMAMQLVRRLRGDVRLIAGIGALALFVTSAGPWGMIPVSARSQFDRLVDRLAEAGATTDGVLTASSTGCDRCLAAQRRFCLPAMTDPPRHAFSRRSTSTRSRWRRRTSGASISAGERARPPSTVTTSSCRIWSSARTSRRSRWRPATACLSCSRATPRTGSFWRSVPVRAHKSSPCSIFTGRFRSALKPMRRCLRANGRRFSSRLRWRESAWRFCSAMAAAGSPRPSSRSISASLICFCAGRIGRPSRRPS